VPVHFGCLGRARGARHFPSGREERWRAPGQLLGAGQPDFEENDMTIKAGDRIPSTTLFKAGADGPAPVASDEYFKGRKIALFSVPGAFTPTCSARHLPGFVERAEELKAKGVDEVACVAVNDAFVMQAWSESAGADGKVTMLADGNADFARALGLTMDGSKFGLGERGSRWSAIVDDGIVEQLNVEEPGAFSVSSADYMMERL
jgi:peroxiredoxin